jgi:UrcA family protein
MCKTGWNESRAGDRSKAQVLHHNLRIFSNKGYDMNSYIPNFTARRASILTVAALLIAAVAPNTFAATDNDGPSITVHFGDLNLNTDAGVRSLYRRIQGAARLVCRDAAGPEAIRYFWKCYDTAVADAVFKVNNTHLIAMYQETGGRKSPS